MDFLKAADNNHIDWRLLPSIAVIESGCTVRDSNNNLFGWKSGHARFPSVRRSIHWIAGRFSKSSIYAGKDTREILRAYNSTHPNYPDRVLAVMRDLPSESSAG
jgi:hypothetical protein